MTHYNQSYKNDPDAEVNAVRDINDYLDEKQWNALMDAVKTDTPPRLLDMFLCMTGVQGFPNHAFIRIFRPDQYQAWYDSLRD